MAPIKVITYNLHKGRGRRRRDILREAMQAIEERRPDVLLCQEVFHGIQEDLGQSSFITRVLGHDHVFGPNAFYKNGCHGNATFARMPVARHHNHDITESWFEKRGILHTALEVGGRDLGVLNTHFSLTGRQRRRQWFKLHDALPEDPDIPVLAAGDFNDWYETLDRQARRSGVLFNCLWTRHRRERVSFPSRRPMFAMDRVYVRGLRVLEAQVLTGEPWSGFSDHLPVEVVVELEG